MSNRYTIEMKKKYNRLVIMNIIGGDLELKCFSLILLTK